MSKQISTFSIFLIFVQLSLPLLLYHCHVLFHSIISLHPSLARSIHPPPPRKSVKFFISLKKKNSLARSVYVTMYARVLVVNRQKTNIKRTNNGKNRTRKYNNKSEWNFSLLVQIEQFHFIWLWLFICARVVSRACRLCVGVCGRGVFLVKINLTSLHRRRGRRHRLQQLQRQRRSHPNFRFDLVFVLMIYSPSLCALNSPSIGNIISRDS